MASAGPRAVIAGWKDGVYQGEALLDDDGRGHDDIQIRATVTKSGSDLVVDLTDSHEQVTSFINSSYANTYSAVVVALSYLIDPDTPKNDGHLPADPADRQARNRSLGQSRRPGHLGNQSLRAGDHRGDHQGVGAGLPRPRDGRLGPAVSYRH